MRSGDQRRRADRSRYRGALPLPKVLSEVVFLRVRDTVDGSGKTLVGVPLRATATATERASLLARVDGIIDVCDGLPAGASGPQAAFVDGDVLYLATEQEPETSLGDLVHEQRPDRAEACEFMSAVVELVDAAHALGLPHGGLDPRSIRVTADGLPVVTGFGLRQVRDDSAVMVGIDPTEEGYGAPDTFYGYPLSAATDLFSIGALIHFMIEGRGPSDGAASGGLAAGDGLGRIVRALLSTEPSLRPNTATVLAALNTGGTSAPELTTAANPWSPLTIYDPNQATRRPAPVTEQIPAYQPDPAYQPGLGYRSDAYPADAHRPDTGHEADTAYQPATGYDSDPAFESAAGYDAGPAHPSATTYEQVGGYEPAPPYRPAEEYEPAPPYLPAHDYEPSAYDTAPSSWARSAARGPDTEVLTPIRDPAGYDRPRLGGVSRRTLIIGGGAIAAGGIAVVAAFALGRSTRSAAGAGTTTPPPAWSGQPSASGRPSASGKPSPAGKPGAARWAAPVPKGSHTPPFTTDTLVIVESATASGVDLSTGSVRWKLPTGALRRFTADPSGTVYAYVELGSAPALGVLDEAAGVVHARFPLPQPVIQMTAGADAVYMLGAPTSAATTATALYAIDATTGRIRWRVTAPFNLRGRVTIDDQHVYVGGAKTVYAVNRANGSIAWQSAAMGGADPGVHAAVAGLVVVHGSQGMGALNASDGTLAWKLFAADLPLLSLPTGIVGGTLYTGALGAGTRAGSVRSVHLDSGKVNWTVTPTTGRARVVADQTGAYVVGGRELVALDIADGSVRWRSTLDGTSDGGPALAGGAVLVATSTGVLHAIATG